MKTNAAWLLLLLAAPAVADDQIGADYHDGRYTVVLDAYVEAPLEVIWNLLTDYENLHQLDERIKESHRLERLSDDTVLVFTRARGCVWFFCKTVSRVEEVQEFAPDRIHSMGIPEKSDLSFSESDWYFDEVAGGTHMRYSMTMEPDFGVPPLIGKMIVRKGLEQAARDLLQSIRTLTAQADPESNADPEDSP